VAWRAYIDDSGQREHSPLLVLGGWISPIAKWAEFVPDWQQMLDEWPPIEYFKMNEAARLIGQFDSWSEQRRDERVRLAYGAIEKHVVYQVSCIIDLEPFYRLFNPSVIEESSINPYYLAFSAIISGVAREQQKLGLRERSISSSTIRLC
jgi:hypothetical protein